MRSGSSADYLQQKAREVVNEKTKSLQRLSAELKSDSQLETLYEESIKTSQDYAVKREAVQRTEGLKLQAEAELKQRQEASSTVYYETFSSARNCPSSHCPASTGSRRLRATGPGAKSTDRRTHRADCAA